MRADEGGVVVPALSQLVVKGSDLPTGLALVNGATFQAGVKADESNQLYVLLQGKKLPIPSSASLALGQRVSITVNHAGAELFLEVTPGPAASAKGSASGSELTELVPRLIRMLGGGTAAPQAASQLMSLLADTQGTGVQISTLTSILQAAHASGATLAPGTLQLLRLFGELSAFDVSELPRLLEQLARDASTPPEARLARAGSFQELAASLDGSLRAQLARLSGDLALMQFVEQSGYKGTLDQLVDALVQRLAGRDLQNLRGFEHPYLFFEVPMPDKAPLKRAFVHVFGERRRDPSEQKGPSTVALDLETQGLGSVWVTLRLHQGRCTCQFRAERRSTGALIDASVDGLREGLREAGYSEAEVSTAPWRASRLVETATWMRSMSGFDARI